MKLEHDASPGRLWRAVVLLSLLAIGVCTLSLAAAAAPATAAGWAESRAQVSTAPSYSETYLKASNAATGDRFGFAVAMDGDTLVVGAPGEDGDGSGVGNHDAPDAGAAYVFVNTGSHWVQQAYLKATNAGAGDFFGSAVAIDGDTIVIGAPAEDGDGSTAANNGAASSGAVYVFVRNGSAWSQQAYLKASNAEAGDGFGQAVAISGNTIVAGAPNEDSGTASQQNNAAPNAGAAYIFVRTGTSWSQQWYLKASGTAGGDLFGWSVAIDGNAVVAGAPMKKRWSKWQGFPEYGLAYAFARSGSTWTQQAIVGPNGDPFFHLYGWSVAINGTRIVIGAPFASGSSPSRLQPYTLSGSSWVAGKATHLNQETGFSVSMTDITLLVGSGITAAGYGTMPTSSEDLLRAGIYTREGNDWKRSTTLQASSGDWADMFGYSTAISGDTYVIAAPFEDGNGSNPTDNSAPDAGAVYVFGSASLTTDRASVDSSGAQATDESWNASISGNGRFVVFESPAGNLVADDTNGLWDVFVHDRQTGQTTRVSVDADGNQVNGTVIVYGNTDISADGRYIAFHSGSYGLVPGNINEGLYVKDRLTGEIDLVSVDSQGNPGKYQSDMPAISADGRYVTFKSLSSTLVPNDTNEDADIFVHDRQTAQTTRVSVNSAGQQAQSPAFGSDMPAISADGRYVAFESYATNLVAGDTNTASDIFVHDRQTGQTTRVSVDSAGKQANGNSSWAAISADGRYVSFASAAGNLVSGDSNNEYDIFVHDRQTGQTSRVSVSSNGTQATGGSLRNTLSADGRYVAFDSDAANLVPGDTNDATDIFLHDRTTGITTRVSVNSANGQGAGRSLWPGLSDDGRSVVFMSGAANLVPADTNDLTDTFVRGEFTRVVSPSVANEEELKSAIFDANNANEGTHTIDLTDDITLTGDLPPLTNTEGEIILNGNGHTIDGGDQFSLIQVMPGVTAGIEGITLTNGLNDYGGAIANQGTVNLSNSTVSSSSALEGGGIWNGETGVLTISGSTIAGNEATSSYGGGIASFGIAELVNTTISGNRAANAGGGFANLGSADATLYNATLSDNEAGLTGGGGYAALDTSASTFYRLLVAGNRTTGGAPGQEVARAAAATLAVASHNLFGHSGQTTAQALAGFAPGTTDRTATSDGTHPTALASILAPTLAGNGGATLTHALPAGSPAIDSAPNAACAAPPVNSIDQRRFGRNVNGDGNPGPSDCDSGAFEYWPAAGIHIAAVNETGLIAAITAVNSAGEGTHVIDMTADVTLTGSLPPFANSEAEAILLDGNGHILDGAGLYSLIQVMPGVTLNIQDITLTNGLNDYGGAITNNGTVNLSNSTVADNTAMEGGGIWNGDGATLVVSGSTISGNTATSSFGGGIANYGTAELVNSTISGNRAFNAGGGMANLGRAEATLHNITLSDNEAGQHGGGYAALGESASTFHRLLIAGNRTTDGGAGQEVVREAPATLAANNHTLFGHSGLTLAQALSGVSPGTTDRTATSDGTHPTTLPDILEPLLAGNGGPTPTHALVGGSPALDSAPNTACAAPPVGGVDQRRAARNLDGDGQPTDSDCDSGAFEYGLSRTYLPVISGAP
jgi:hypothetical protein